MTAYSIAAFHVLTGVCMLAAVRHMSNGLWRPIDKANLLFGVMCCCAAGMAWTQAQLYQTWSIAEHRALLKWNISFALVFFLVMPWFTSAVTGRQPLRWLKTTSVVFVAILTLNVSQPFGVQLADIERIETKVMPWGETYASPAGPLAPSFWFAIAAVLVAIVDSIIRFLSSWQRDRSGTSMLMALSTAVYFVAATEGILVRAQVIGFMHLGPIGFFAMVIAMSLTLSFRSRRNLLASEQRFRALVEQSPFGIQVLAVDGATVQVNPAWERLWGKTASESPRVADESLLPVIERAFLGHKGETNPMPRDNQWIRSFVYPIKDPGGEVRNVIVMHEDVTEEKRAADEARLATAELSQVKHTVLQQERLRALGQMAGGIAHDINNAISPAALYIESLLEQDKTLNSRARERLTIVQQAIAAVVQTVARLREFCRPRESQAVREAVDLNQVVRQSVDLTRARWQTMAQGKGIAIQMKLELGDGLPTILGSESEIRDAVVNLVFNAVDAMPEGGTITLQTRALGNGASIEVRDTGAGMDEQTRRRCLEPFFSTKGEHGSGLGLAMVYGMLTRHGGQIEIVSEPGRGTIMRLLFSVDSVRPERQTTVAPPPGASTRARIGARILLADDDPLLLESLRAALEEDGHHVLTADDGQSAIDAFEAADKAGAPFAVVITDFVMPIVDGRKVSTVVNRMRPGTPVIMLTAWGNRMSTQDDTLPYVDHILAKPANLSELRNTLERLLRR